MRPRSTEEDEALRALGARRRRLFPDFDAARVLHDAGGVVVIDKPAGVPSQSPDADLREDLPHRLGLFFVTRGEAPYVGVHQRLDRDTSGVIAYARDEGGNRFLAAQIEGRRAEKTYLACVRGWRGGARTLKHALVKGAHGMEVASPRDPRGKIAISHVEPIERVGDRVLVRVRIETGRTHQIRVQLAHEGAPVAGDPIYGGPPAPRLMLHAWRLTFDAPASDASREASRRSAGDSARDSARDSAGDSAREPMIAPTIAPTTFEAPPPPSFARWMRGLERVDYTDRAAIDEALRDAMERRWGLARACVADATSIAGQPTTTFRLVHGEGDGLPGLTVDVYHDHLVASLYDEAAPHEDTILDALHALGFVGVYVKRRPKQASTIVDPRRAEVAPSEAVRGTSAAPSFLAWENGARFVVSLGDGLSTGIFLDMRDVRRRVRDVASGRRVLNLFAYTGPFSVAAATGGAAEVVTVDVATPALATCEASFAANALDVPHRLVKTDCFVFLDKAVQRGERYDLVVCDPPTFATTKRTRWTSGKQWIELAAQCFVIAAPGAIVLLCTNDARLDAEVFRRHVRAAATRAGVALTVLRSLPSPWDFPSAPGQPHPFKRLWCEVGGSVGR
ncbi:MAG: class I SAM-dependent methyltransferase [Myxococcota bacterium]|jgi:23S rRNA (cytosine1962-C5)-methyltransferase|nr:class I SAM-dependent methyltransferase [Myxococcota bacterium]